MSGIKRALLFYACLPLNVFLAWPLVLAIRLLWGRDLRWERWILSCELEPESWPLGGAIYTDTGALNGYLRKTRTWGGRWWSWLWPRGWYLHNRGEAVGTAKPRPWGGTAAGDGQFFRPGARAPKGTPIEELPGLVWHEDRHVRQARASQVRAATGAHLLVAVLALWGSPVLGAVLGLLVWTLGGNAGQAVGGFIAAILEEDPRGFYRGSAHEIDAYDSRELWNRLTPEERRHRLEEG